MKKILFAALLLAGTAVTHPALADRWVAPMNGMVSAVMMQDGSVMMKVQMPPKEFAAMEAMMHDANSGCMIQEIYPDAHNTMILVCK